MSQDPLEIIKIEENILSTCLSTIDEQLHLAEQRLIKEEERSRELTSEILTTRRAEDKAQLMSDEAVSHSMKDKGHTSANNLYKQKDKPYFARMILAEEIENENHPDGFEIKEIEYRLGNFSNADCRIVDWRKAPIAKVYYDYKEGEEYSEEIMGKDRFGTIKLRNSVEVSKGELKAIRCSKGFFKKSATGWNISQSTTDSSVSIRENSSEGSYSALPSILPLITADQFKLITSNPKASIIIDGIAGSGKTTVALHRLSWLGEQTVDGKKTDSENFLIITRSEFLKSYIKNSATKLDLNFSKILTFQEFIAAQLKHFSDISSYKVSNILTPTSITRILFSDAMLSSIRKFKIKTSSNYLIKENLLTILKNYNDFLLEDTTKLINKASISECYSFLEKDLKEEIISLATATLLIFAKIPFSEKICFEHILIDETQDFAPLELELILSFLKKEAAATCIGDKQQNIYEASEATNNSNNNSKSLTSSNTSQPTTSSWVTRVQSWIKAKEECSLINLTVSHRNTAEIMQFASQISQRPVPPSSKHGRLPIWFKTRSEQVGILKAKNWLDKAVELYPSGLQAIICFNQEEVNLVYKYLEPSFGSAITKINSSFWADSGIIVLTVKQSKGLEFTNVLLWNPSEQKYPNSDLAKNMLYTAVTRAENNMCIVSWGKASSLLPTNSKFVRVMQEFVEE